MRMTTATRRTTGLLAGLVLLGGCGFVAPATLSSTGLPSDGRESAGPATNLDGRFVAFNSLAENLVPSDTNGVRDVFVRDLVANTTERVSVTTAGAEAHGDSQAPMLDYAGRQVVFNSSAPDLVPGDTNGVQDVFVHDRATGITQRVSVSTAGTQANDASAATARPAISGNGRFVAFPSAATNLVPNDTNGVADVFVHDLWTGTTEIVTRALGGGAANGATVGNVSLSYDGRYVAFGSAASNLVRDDTNGRQDTFVYDRLRGVTILASLATDGTRGNGDTQHLGTWISGDGRVVTFQSSASNLVPNDTNGAKDVFVHELLTGVTTRVNVASDGTQAQGGDPNEYTDGSLSYDGRFVTYDETAPNLVPGDTNGAPDTFVYDRLTRRTERVSVAPDGTQADSYNGNHMISADGRYVAFGTVSSNLIPGDANGRGYDIAVAAVLRPVIDSVLPAHVRRGSSTTLTVAGAWLAGDAVATLGAGIAVRSIALADPTHLSITVAVDTTAAPGARDLFVGNPGSGPGVTAGGLGWCRGCVVVD